VLAGIKLATQLTPGVHEDVPGEYTFGLLNAASTSTTAGIMEGAKAPPQQPPQPVPHNRTVTLFLGELEWANQTAAVAICNHTHAALAVPHNLDDLWQLNRGVAEALAMQGDFTVRSAGWVLLGGHKTAQPLWLTPAVPSTGSAPPIPGMNKTTLVDGTALWAPESSGLSGDCLRLINWSNLQYSAWLHWGDCDVGTYACLRTV
jgi:hypothetical protein